LVSVFIVVVDFVFNIESTLTFVLTPPNVVTLIFLAAPLPKRFAAPLKPFFPAASITSAILSVAGSVKSPKFATNSVPFPKTLTTFLPLPAAPPITPEISPAVIAPDVPDCNTSLKSIFPVFLVVLRYSQLLLQSLRPEQQL